jgi:hypothetical protein
MQRPFDCVWVLRDSGRVRKLILMAAVAFMVMVFAGSGCPPPPPPPPLDPHTLPTDARDDCPLSSATFSGWFQTGTPSLNGVVNPADSLNFPDIPNCSFYEWSEHMFLWLTSPTPPEYGGGGGRIFDSAPFFDVSPLDGSGHRTFVPHRADLIRSFSLRAAQLGPGTLPVILDKSGQMLQFESAEKGATLQVRSASGELVTVAHARMEKNGTPILLDKANKVIKLQAAKIEKTTDQQQTRLVTAKRFIIDGIPIFVDPSLAVIEVEQGQAEGNGVLEAQKTANGSLVYYQTIVNDVYAYFATGVKDHAITATQFPINATDLANITAFASGHATFPDPNALAVEVKSSWVEATGLPNLSSYITMTATIPTYDTSSTTTWTLTGQKTVQLALVGFHVVGSTGSAPRKPQGHPEMIWATFEHFANAPRAAYSYFNTSSSTINIAQNTNATWLFCATNSSGPFNQEHMNFSSPPNINANTGFTISPSDTLRIEPFGIDGSNAGSNTQVISMNNHVRGMLVGGDIRGNYIMTGATWTPFGAPPTGGNGVGTNLLSNTTMETYQQGTNCFTCHNQPMLGDPTGNGLSHIFGPLQPLF